MEASKVAMHQLKRWFALDQLLETKDIAARNHPVPCY
jgi:hypothetical protein